MAKIYYFIQRKTLAKIADAIRLYTGTNKSIPVGNLDDVLSGKEVNSTLKKADLDTYVIERQTLVDIAEIVRKITGSTAQIPVTQLAEKILELIGGGKKLDTPVIRLVVESEEGTGTIKLATPVIQLVTESSGDATTTAVLGKAILGQAILGNTGTDDDSSEVPAVQLSAPVIYLESVEDGTSDESPVTRLEEPTIYLETTDDEPTEEEPVVLEKLATPVITLVEE